MFTFIGLSLEAFNDFLMLQWPKYASDGSKDSILQVSKEGTSQIRDATRTVVFYAPMSITVICYFNCIHLEFLKLFKFHFIINS